ncbi:MAG: prepilin peptidase [Phycisphaerales bacterium]|nr:prepilin peptidase [Phycisphaerales bacterium]
MIALSVWLIASASTGRADEHAAPSLLRNWPTIASLVVLFIAMVISGSHPRDVDAEIAGVIESEGASARGTAWRELFWLLPAIVAGVVVAIATAHYPVVVGLWDGLVRWSPIAGFAPIAGTVYSLVGIFAGVAAGWFLRIFFTLVFGREAFGVGDIYILAAAGAVGGWQIALLGLLLSVGLATVGWLLSLIFKSTLIIPFGPWLALGFLMALWLERPAGEIAAIYRESIEIARRERPELLWLLGAIMLAGMAIAVVFARLARQLVAPHMTQHESALHVQTPSSESSSVAQPDPPINPETSDDARGA